MQERWIKWEPLENLETKYYIDSIIDNLEGFEMLLSEYRDRNKKILILFNNSVEAFRSNDETSRLKTLYQLTDIYGSKFYGEWTFFKVENSTYVKWIVEESCGIRDSKYYTHFAFISGEGIVDVIATYEPIVRHLENN